MVAAAFSVNVTATISSIARVLQDQRHDAVDDQRRFAGPARLR